MPLMMPQLTYIGKYLGASECACIPVRNGQRFAIYLEPAASEALIAIPLPSARAEVRADPRSRRDEVTMSNKHSTAISTAHSRQVELELSGRGVLAGTWH